ncbi:sigma-70 family RNA polymerase sigma factor [Hydrocarboniclastica marina]|uniref:RNA polymerase subunit sigma n=1 Tax=Hydrocarboniclastica marina TaxID=2259620 RepID=A0A4P7XDN5_9ALTE|nr:sigma-70 family RNA polymerase sigma factor [Hydrocarboniclastica marina]MAL99613.1 RNA polymerase subunit sigma [Alteromonadaceae bacterium]QCF24981.1 RNA polymerase subunit sigma [Hydrocarboniclastica marina]
MTDSDTDSRLIGLLAATARRDRDAFRRLYEHASPRMLGLCVGLLGQREQAEEVLQEAFIRIWHHAGEYHEERGSPMAWMQTIARYKALDTLRARRRTAGTQSHEIADARPGPFELSLQDADAQALNGCIEELSDDQRSSILMCYYKGFTHEELATALDTPLGTIKSWIRRGLTYLKRCLQQ